MKFEAVVIPVSDVDRAKTFYTNLGWRLDADFPFENGFRVVQLTPPGSECSIQFGTKITSAGPGSARGLYLIVSDINAARNELPPAVSTSATYSMPGHRALSFNPTAPAVALPGQHQITQATVLLPHSVTRMATDGCSRRSQHGCPGDWTPRRRPTHQRMIWPVPCAERRPRTGSMKRGLGSPTRTGRTGTPSL